MPHTLLVADPSPPVRRVIEVTLAGEGIEVLATGDGRHAIEIIEAVRPDLVLADVSLPGVDGYGIAAFIKSDPRLAAIPVLLLHSAREPLDTARATHAGCDGDMAKPFEPTTLIDAVKGRLAGSDARAAGSAAGAAPGQTARGEAGEAPAGTTLERSGADALDAYFDRLGAAFENLDARPGRRHGGAAASAPHDVSEASACSPAGSEPSAEGGRGAAESGRILPVPMGDVLATLFKPEAGGGIERPGHPPASARMGSIPDELVDEIARRVLRRLHDDTMRALIVETAERVVREEIARIKAACAQPPSDPGNTPPMSMGPAAGAGAADPADDRAASGDPPPHAAPSG